MAEILSSIPTSGGPYFWAYMLAPQHSAPFFAWITGWSEATPSTILIVMADPKYIGSTSWDK